MSFRPLSSRRASNAENEAHSRTKRLSETAKSRSALGDLSNGDSVTKSVVPPSSRNPLLARSINIPSKPLPTATAGLRPLITKPQPILRPLKPVEPQPVRSTEVGEADRGDVGDPKFVAEYVGEIFARLLKSSDAPVGDYLSGAASVSGSLNGKGSINEAMRGVLVDWLVEVHWKFKLYPESLFLCVSLLDRFLARTSEVSKSQFQLVGTTCLLIAAKYEDIYAPEIKDLVLICEKTYKKDEILAMEVKILNTVEFQLTIPSALLYLLRLGKLQGCDERHFYLAQYCLELALPQYALWTSKSALELAAAALYLSNKLLRKPRAWSAVLVEMCGLGEAELKPVAKELCNLLQTASDAEASKETTRMKAVKNKFSQTKYHCVAKMVL